MEKGAGSVDVSARPALPNTDSTSGNCFKRWSIVCSSFCASVTASPGMVACYADLHVHRAARPAHAMRLLLIEDDSMLGRALLAGLRQDGHATDWVRTAADAHSAWLAPKPSIVPYEVIVLDLGLPDGGGLDL